MGDQVNLFATQPKSSDPLRISNERPLVWPTSYTAGTVEDLNALGNWPTDQYTNKTNSFHRGHFYGLSRYFPLPYPEEFGERCVTSQKPVSMETTEALSNWRIANLLVDYWTYFPVFRVVMQEYEKTIADMIGNYSSFCNWLCTFIKWCLLAREVLLVWDRAFIYKFVNFQLPPRLHCITLHIILLILHLHNVKFFWFVLFRFVG